MISTPGTTIDGGEVDVVYESMHDLPAYQRDLEERRSARFPVMTDVNNAPDVIRDVEMVLDQSDTQPQSCLRELTPDVNNDMVSDREKNQSNHHPDVITRKECEAHRQPNHRLAK